MKPFGALFVLLVSLGAFSAAAQDVPDYSELRAQALSPKYPLPTEKNFLIKNFQFQSGEVLPELRIHYRTLGNRNGPKVLILHGSGGQGSDFLLESIAPILFGPEGPLDARKYFIILPDNIGHGKSSKPSDGMGAAFPKYSVADSVAAQFQLVTEGLGITHLRLVLGHSMGGRQTWIWGAQYPDFMDALVPMANSPGNWAARAVTVHDAVSTIPPLPDAQNTYVLESRTVPAPVLENIKAYVLAINAADDPGNAPERSGIEAAVARTPHGSFYVIPAGRGTVGHATTFLARFWVKPFKTFLDTVPGK